MLEGLFSRAWKSTAKCLCSLGQFAVPPILQPGCRLFLWLVLLGECSWALIWSKAWPVVQEEDWVPSQGEEHCSQSPPPAPGSWAQRFTSHPDCRVLSSPLPEELFWMLLNHSSEVAVNVCYSHDLNFLLASAVSCGYQEYLLLRILDISTADLLHSNIAVSAFQDRYL